MFLTSSVRMSGPVLFILESPPRGGGGSVGDTVESSVGFTFQASDENYYLNKPRVKNEQR